MTTSERLASPGLRRRRAGDEAEGSRRRPHEDLRKAEKRSRLARNLLDKLRPEFRSGLDALTRFVFERTRPMQLGAIVMNGPLLAGIRQSFLDELNNGAVLSITSSWQSVEEAECRRAFDAATEVYMASFHRSKPLEVALREADEEEIQKTVGAFNGSVVGAESVRHKYEKLLDMIACQGDYLSDLLNDISLP
ncbi:hypothetical protein Dimus_024333 [Dionaea muscipula]